MTILAANNWKSNAELIYDVHKLGYLKDDDLTIDVTYGRGIWWKLWKPERLITHDIAIDGIDFRILPYRNNSFDAIAYDPPYVSVGGRKTSTIKDFQNRYGMDTAPKTPQALQVLINEGLCELQRVIKPKGILLVKCQDYISSGKLWNGTFKTQSAAQELGFMLIDKFEHITHPRPQPPNRRQVHARRNLSTLFIFQGA